MYDVKNILPKYFEILEENHLPQFIQSKHSPVSFNDTDSINTLWKQHDIAMKKLKVRDVKPDQSVLDLKIELANRIFQDCVFCERRCKVDRRKTSGNCNVKESRIASEFLHFGEERVLIPSYTIFFSGCTFHCVFCQNWDISQNICGVQVEPSVLADMIIGRKHEGGINVNWVGGDPTSNLLYILKVLRELDINIPQIWNSNMYCSTETMDLLKGVIDVYLTDFKYGNDECAHRLSKVDNYTKIVKRNHKIAYNQGEIILRHLVLPNHIECCSKLILEWISKNIPNAAVNVMPQYRPEYHAYEHKDLAKPLSLEEYREVKQYAENLNLYLI